MQPLEPDDPRTLGQYRMLRRLGSGGMGRVYLARSHGGRTVAVKVVHPHFAVDEVFRERFRREVSSAQRVGGQWTAPVLDADPDAHLPWAATGYVAGPSLQDAVARYGPLPPESVRALGAGLAEALAHVHGLGLLHRDVKPSNVLLTVDGPLLIDFGIARATDSSASLTSTGVSIGSPGYMAPEQVLGEGSATASDVFSLGAVLAFAATGNPPFSGDNSAVLLYKVVHEKPELADFGSDDAAGAAGPAGSGGETAGGSGGARAEAEGGERPDGEAAGGGEAGLRALLVDCLTKEPDDRPTTEQLTLRLAGREGDASGLIRSGWLPGPIVEQVSRRAVELLNLESVAEDGRTPSHSEQPADGGGGRGQPDQQGALGAFGPPPDISAGSEQNRWTPPGSAPPSSEQNRWTPPGSAPPPSDRSGHPGGGEGADGAGSSAPSPPSGSPGGARSLGPSPSAGKPTRTEGSSEKAGEGSWRARRPLMLVAGLVLALLGAGALVLNLIPPGGGDTGGSSSGADGGGSGGSDGGKGSGGGDGGQGGEGDIPESFLGTWTGKISTENVSSQGTIRVEIREGGTGDNALTITSVPNAPGQDVECEGKAKVEKVSAKKLTLLEYGMEDPPKAMGLELCDTQDVRATIVRKGDDTLRYSSQSQNAGSPRADLTREGS